MIHIAVNIALFYLAIGALIWALMVAPGPPRLSLRDLAGTLLVCLSTWPLRLARGIAKARRTLADIEEMRRHCR